MRYPYKRSSYTLTWFSKFCHLIPLIFSSQKVLHVRIIWSNRTLGLNLWFCCTDIMDEPPLREKCPFWPLFFYPQHQNEPIWSHFSLRNQLQHILKIVSKAYNRNSNDKLWRDWFWSRLYFSGFMGTSSAFFSLV